MKTQLPETNIQTKLFLLVLVVLIGYIIIYV